MDKPTSPPGGVSEHPWPVYRNNIVDFLDHSKRRHHVSATWEADVTDTLETIARIQREIRFAISLNAYLVHGIARAAMAHPEMQSVRIRWRRKIARFDGADVGTAVEQRIPGQGSLALPYTVRRADKKSLAEICLEMRTAAKSNLLTSDPGIRWRGRLAHYPAWLRRLIWTWVDLDPARRRRVRGTIGLTNVNFLMDENRPVFGYPMALLTTGLCAGSIYNKLVPEPSDPRGFTTRKFMCLTLVADHDLVDGAPMARFARTFNIALQAGAGLDDAFAAELKERFQAAQPFRARSPSTPS